MVQPGLAAAAPGPVPRPRSRRTGRRSPAASSSPRKRISIAPSSSPRGWRSSDAAERELEAALAINPRFVAAWVNLGNLHAQRGDRAPARRAYEQALALEPAQPLALSRLPDLRPIAGPDDPLIATLRQAIARPGASAADLADLGFGLGKALDTAGAYDEAFAAYVAANQASRASAGDAAARYDAPAHERFVDRLIAAFPAPLPADARGAGRDPADLHLRHVPLRLDPGGADPRQPSARHRRRRDRGRAGDRGAPLRAVARRLAGARCREPAEAARRLRPPSSPAAIPTPRSSPTSGPTTSSTSA